MQAQEILRKVDGLNKKQEKVVSFAIGDLVGVSTRIKEGDKERTQTFTGTVIARKGVGASETITVRRVSFGIGVERVYPVHAPSIVSIEVLKSSKVRRAKLYYLRKLSGKKARLKAADSR